MSLLLVLSANKFCRRSIEGREIFANKTDHNKTIVSIDKKL